MGLFKSLIIFATVYCVGINAQAATEDKKPPVSSDKTAEKKDENKKKSVEWDPGKISSDNNRAEIAYCEGQDKQLAEARKAVTVACNESRLGDCFQRAKECYQQFSAEENKDLDTMNGNMSDDKAKKQCPLSAEDAGDLEKKIEKQQDKFEKLEKDALADKKEAAKSFDALQEEIATNDKNYKEAKIQASEAKMKQDVEIDKAFSQIAEDIESTHSQILESQAKLADMMSSKAERLAQMSNAIIQSDCEIKIMEIAAKIPGANSGSSQGMIKAGSNKNKTLKTRYNQCIQGMLNARKKLIESYDNSTQQLEYAIARLQTKVKRREDDILKVQKNAQASLENAQKNSDLIDENYNSNKLRLANKLSNLSTQTSQQELQNYTNLQTTNAELRRSSNDLARIGGSKSKNVKKLYSDVNSTNEEYFTLLENFPRVRCCGAKHTYETEKGPEEKIFSATSCKQTESGEIEKLKKAQEEGAQ